MRKDTTADRRPAKKKRKATSERSLEADAKRLRGQSPEPRAESAEGVQTLSSSSSTASLCSAHGSWTICAGQSSHTSVMLIHLQHVKGKKTQKQTERKKMKSLPTMSSSVQQKISHIQKGEGRSVNLLNPSPSPSVID